MPVGSNSANNGETHWRMTKVCTPCFSVLDLQRLTEAGLVPYQPIADEESRQLPWMAGKTYDVARPQRRVWPGKPFRTTG